MRRIFVPGALVFLISACVEDGASSKVQISAKYGACGSAHLEKVSAYPATDLKYDSTGTVLFRSEDSLQVAFLADMGCNAEHTEKYSQENDSTLKVDWSYSSSGGNPGCACRKVAFISAASKEMALDKIHYIDFNGLKITF
jgi:hypothetical protein